MRFSLRVKIVLTSIALIILGGFLSTFAVFSYTKNALIELKKESVERNNKERVKETELLMEIAENIVESISGNSSVANFLFSIENKNQEIGANENISAVMDEKIEESDTPEDSVSFEEIETELFKVKLGNIFDIIYVTDASGTVVASTDKTLLGNNYSFRDYYTEAVKNGSFIDFSVGVTTKKAGYYFSRKIVKDGKFIGLVVGKMGEQVVEETIKDSTSFEDSDSMLVDRWGVIISSNKPERLYKSTGPLASSDMKNILETKRYASGDNIQNLSYDFIIPAIKSGETFMTYDFFDKLDGEDEIVTLVKIGDYPFYLVSEIEKDGFIEPAKEDSLILAGIVLMTALAVATLLSYAVYSFLSPIIELKKVVESIGKKDFSKKFEVRTNDEFGELGKILNDASNELREMHDELEEKVKLRTKSLEDVNNIMIGRELKMVELKNEISMLKKEIEKKDNSKTLKK